jgi:hypothetical protein
VEYWGIVAVGRECLVIYLSKLFAAWCYARLDDIALLVSRLDLVEFLLQAKSLLELFI